jgi:hypothetical protein
MGVLIMRNAQLSAIAALVWLTAHPAFAQPSLGQIEQRLQGLLNPAPQAGATDPNAGGYLGAELDDEGEQGRGVRVKSVRPGAPAEKSGLKANDLITTIDGKRITNLDDYDANAKRPPNAKLAFTIERDGRSQPLTVTLGTRPATGPTTTEPAPSDVPPAAPTLSPPGAPPASGSPSLLPPTGSSSPSTLPTPSAPDTTTRPGIVAQPQEPRSPASEPTPATSAPGPAPAPAAGGGGASLGIKVAPPNESGAPGARTRRGALIASVNQGSPADLAGLKAGALIVQMDGRSINSDDDLVAAIRAARPFQEVELTYYEGDRLGRKLVRLGQAGGGSAPPAPGGVASGGTSPPAAPGLGQRAPAGRAPLINRVEQLVDNFSRAQGVPLQGLPTVPTNYDPSAMASLIKSVTELSESVMRLEDRIKALEAKQSGSAPAPAPQAPGFGTSGTGTSSSSPGPSFGPPSGGGATNP